MFPLFSLSALFPCSFPYLSIISTTFLLKLSTFFFQSFYYSCLPKSNIGPVRLSTTSRILYRFVNTTEEKDSTMRYISVTVYFCYSSCAQLPPSLLSILLGFPKFATHHLPTPSCQWVSLLFTGKKKKRKRKGSK